jgi:WD40 repeat protein
LRGAGGYGKTTLAKAVCHDLRIKEFFRDGILWITLGENPDIKGYLDDWIQSITSRRSNASSEVVLEKFLREALGERCMLLVIDDVWDSAHLKPFLQGGINCSRLITTRTTHVLPEKCISINVDAMNSIQSVDLLTKDIDLGEEVIIQEKYKLNQLSIRLGKWPLLLSLARREIYRRIRDFDASLEDAINHLNEALTNKGLTAFDANNTQDREQAISKTLAVSLESLSDIERIRYSKLAIFPEDVDIPFEILKFLWEISDFFVMDTCDIFYDRSLLFQLRNRSIRLHDVIRSFLRDSYKNEIIEFNHHFLRSCKSQLNSWSNLSNKNIYLWNNLSFHLKEAGLTDELHETLFDFSWLKNKIELTNVTHLTRDFEFADSNNTDLSILQKAILLSADALSRDNNQLLGQVFSRLQNERGKILFAKLKNIEDKNTIYTLFPSLIQASESPILNQGHSGHIEAISSFHNRYIVSGSADCKIKVWDSFNGHLVHDLQGHSDRVLSLANINGYFLASGSADKTVKIWDIESGKLLKTLEGNLGGIRALAVSGDKVISGSNDGVIKIWDIEKGYAITTIDAHEDKIRSIVCLDEFRIVSCSNDKTIKIWNTRDGSLEKVLRGHHNWILTLAIVNGKLISGSFDKSIIVWNISEGKPDKIINSHTDRVRDIISIDGSIFASASYDKLIKIWNLENYEQLAALSGHFDWILSIHKLSPQKLVSGSADCSLKIWNLHTGQQEMTLKGQANPIRTLTLLNNKQAITNTFGSKLQIWKINSGILERVLDKDYGNITASLVLGNGDIVLGSDDGSLRILNKRFNSLRSLWKGHSTGVSSLCIYNKKYLISGFTDGSLKVWQIDKMQIKQNLVGHSSEIRTISIVNEDLIISGSFDRSIKVWDFKSGKVLRDMRCHTGGVLTTTILPTGKVASAGGDCVIQIWDYVTGKIEKVLNGHSDWIRVLKVSRDGRLISGSADRTVKIWNLELDIDYPVLTFNVDSPIFTMEIVDSKTLSLIIGDEAGKIHHLRIPNN